MNKIGRFVTLLPESNNIDLVKDVGQIPFILKKYYQVETAYASCNFDFSGANIDEVETLELIPLKKIFNSDSLTGLFFILKNASGIDWLNLYHAGRRTLVWTRVYKFLNPRGKVYLKLDLDFRSCDKFDKDLRERRLFIKNVNACDLTTIETESVWKRIQPYAAKEIKIIGNGYAKTNHLPDVKRERSNTFLTVGRLGTRQKATEILLEAFAKSAPYHNWNLKLIGSTLKEFQTDINEFYLRYPNLRERVVFGGVISKREKLYDCYLDAKVFVLPSRWESFALVGPEAAFCGCKMIISNQVPTADIVTDYGKYGVTVPVDDIDALAEALVAATKEEYSGELSQAISEYAAKVFEWENICGQLYGYLEACES